MSNTTITTPRPQSAVRFGLAWVLLLAVLLSSCAPAQSAKVYRVGVLSGLSAFSGLLDGFKAKMTELGYVEGENIVYDVQSTEVDIEAYKSITQKFVTDKVDLIFSFPTEASVEAKAAAAGNIPVVFAMAFTNVEGIDLINSIREPGGNITGVRSPIVEMAVKRLNILLEIVPTAKRILVPYLAGYPSVPSQLEALHQQADSLGIELIEVGAGSPPELQASIDQLTTSGEVNIDAILMLAEPLAITPPFYAILGKFSADYKIPMGGALMSIGGYETLFGLLPSPFAVGGEAAILADKVLKGTSAGTIPVFTANTVFQINYKAAQALGVAVPESLLKQADEVIR